jgi:nucleoside diphosphate kinase
VAGISFAGTIAVLHDKLLNYIQDKGLKAAVLTIESITKTQTHQNPYYQASTSQAPYSSTLSLFWHSPVVASVIQGDTHSSKSTLS